MNKARYILFIYALLIIPKVNSCRKIDDPPDNSDKTDFSKCIIPGQQSTFEILTFNVELFPKSGFETIDKLAEIIETARPDLVAFQEISSETDFDKLGQTLNNYTTYYYPIDNSDWNLAFLVGNDCSVDVSETKVLFQGDYSAFPRPPFEIHVTHNPTAIDVIVINNHFKCCGGYDNELRRRSASEKLHNYIDTEYPNEPVIVLGDLNDEITDPVNENVFQVFLDDPDNYLFTDLSIAAGSPVWWSYPSYPSHIDHILVTNELFGNIDTIMVFKPDACFSEYSNIISDHRPVCLRLK